MFYISQLCTAVDVHVFFYMQSTHTIGHFLLTHQLSCRPAGCCPIAIEPSHSMKGRVSSVSIA
ncbi:hypothetical protein E2C01_026364 [Portunus trituberculatus]|uniref:Uncharacterized protein n=1 Tax=Portunus trituberculatus TaxID=210409 RepID=A0A5B7EHY8_PORTR|nr:hypothetical protein [Portunus trituberculatus]